MLREVNFVTIKSVHDKRKTFSNNLVHRNLPLFNGVCYRSIGIQCNPSTANQSTAISTADIVTMDDKQLESDRHIRIIRPSSPLMQSLAAKRAQSQELTINGIKCEEEDSVEQQRIIVTSTCLDDDQMVIIKQKIFIRQN